MRRTIAAGMVMLTLAVTALAAPTTGPSISTYRDQLTELFSTRLLDRINPAGKLWEEAAQKLCLLTIQAMADEQVEPLAWPTGRLNLQEMAALADDVLAKGCDDPAVLFCCMRAYTRAWRDDDARKLIPALKDVGARRLPAMLVVSIRDEIALVSRDPALWAEIDRERTAALTTVVNYTNEPINDAHLRYALKLVREDADHHEPTGGLVTVYQRSIRSNRAHAWLRKMLEGDLELHLAMEERGVDLPRNFNPDPSPEFIKHVAAAKTHYTEASRLKPGLPESWAGLIRVAAAREEPADAAIQAGLAAEMDSRAVWDAATRNLTQGWDFDFEKIAAMGRRGIDTGRYDTLAPYRFVTTVDQADSVTRASFGANLRIWQDPDLRDPAIKVLKQYGTEAGTSDRAARFLVGWLETAIKIEDFSSAREAAELMKKLDPAARQVALDPSRGIAISMAYAMTGVQGSLLGAARGTLAAGEWDAAQKTLGRILAAMPESDPGRLYVRHAQLVVSRQTQFDAGEWVDLTPQADFLGWRALAGDWRLIDGVAHAGTTDVPLVGMSHVRVKGPLEISAKLEFERPTIEKSAGAGIWLRGLEGPSTAVWVHCFPLDGKIRIGTAEGEQVLEIKPTTTIELKISVDDLGVTVRSGEAKLRLAKPRLGEQLSSDWLWATIRQADTTDPARMRLSIREFRVRKLPDAKPQIAGAARSTSDYRRDLVEIYETGLLEHAQIKDTAWEEPARRMIGLTAQALADERLDPLIWPKDAARTEELVQLADRLVAARCDDPSVLFCCLRAYVRAWRDDDARAIARKLADIEPARFAPVIDFALQDELCTVSTDRKDWSRIPRRRTQAVWAVARATGTETRFNDSLLRLSLEMTREDDSRYSNLENDNTIMAQTSRQADVNPWLVHILKGQNLVGDAWRVRGSGWAADVDPDAWPVFGKQIDNATREFAAAAELKPALPEAWAGLITTGMASSQPTKPYFERGFAAELDSQSVWSSMQNASLPRWGGSHEEMIETARRGLATARYDTLGPYRYFDMLRRIDRDRRAMGPEGSLWDDEQLTDSTIEVLNQYIDDAGPGDRAARYLGVLLEHSMSCGRYLEARDAAIRLTRLPAPARLRGVTGVPAVWISWPHAYASDARPIIEEATKLLDEHDSAGAKAACERALVALGPEHAGRIYVQHLLAAANAELQFQTGEWVNLTPTETMAGWNAAGGEWRWIDGAYHAAGDGTAIRLNSRARLRGPMELIAKIDIPRPTTDNQALVGIGLIGGSGANRAQLYAHLFPLFGDFRATTLPEHRVKLDGPPQTTVEIRVRIDATGVTINNGERSFAIGDDAALRPLLTAYLQPIIRQGAYYKSPRMRIVIRDFRVRKLP